MKTKQLLFVLLAIATLSFNAQPKTYHAKVQTINGVDAYIMSEPIRNYEIVIGKDKPLNLTSLLTGGLINNSIKARISQLVTATLKQAEKDNITLDAVIYTSGKAITGIKYTDTPTPETDKVAEVQKMGGVPVYVLAEPFENYRIVSEEGGGIKWKSLVTGGLINNSIEEDIQKYVDKFEKKIEKGKIDAILYSGGKDADGIKFN